MLGLIYAIALGRFPREDDSEDDSEGAGEGSSESDSDLSEKDSFRKASLWLCISLPGAVLWYSAGRSLDPSALFTVAFVCFPQPVVDVVRGPRLSSLLKVCRCRLLAVVTCCVSDDVAVTLLFPFQMFVYDLMLCPTLGERSCNRHLLRAHGASPADCLRPVPAPEGVPAHGVVHCMRHGCGLRGFATIET